MQLRQDLQDQQDWNNVREALALKQRMQLVIMDADGSHDTSSRGTCVETEDATSPLNIEDFLEIKFERHLR